MSFSRLPSTCIFLTVAAIVLVLLIALPELQHANKPREVQSLPSMFMNPKQRFDEALASLRNASHADDELRAGEGLMTGLGSEDCVSPKVDWQRLPRKGCTMMEKVCIDQNRFIAFESEYMRPGASFEEGRRFFEPHSTHNIPGYPDNVKGTKSLWFPVMARANSTRDPPDIRSPSFQSCTVPLIWWPWWAFNPSDFYLSSVLGLERLQREGIIDRGVQFVPVLDGLERMPFHEWFLSPFSDHKVESLAEVSARTRLGRRCYERILLCQLQGFWNWPPEGSWLDGLQPSSVGRQIVQHHLYSGNNTTDDPTIGPQSSVKVALIERKGHRKILNLEEVAQRCRGLAPADGRALTCTIISFDDIRDFPALLRELQTIDILVGMHGAGLMNAFFMRPGTAFVEIFPCGFGNEHHRHYYWHPSHVEAQIYAFQLFVNDPARCRPSALAAHPEELNDGQGPAFVQQTLARDQDVILDFELLADMLSRVLPVLNGTSDAFRALLQLDPEYFVIR